MSHPSMLISAYLDGELSRDEVGRLLDHLAGCGRCAAELEATQHVRTAVRSLPMMELPGGIELLDPLPQILVCQRRCLLCYANFHPPVILRGRGRSREPTAPTPVPRAPRVAALATIIAPEWAHEEGLPRRGSPSIVKPRSVGPRNRRVRRPGSPLRRRPRSRSPTNG